MKKVILLIDGDNIDESYTQSILENAKAFGEVYEAHCFADFVKKKQRWYSAYTECKMQLHYVPGSEKHKGKPDPNTSDIAMTVLAMERLYECPEIDVCIIVANDKDYIPLAKIIREKFHKKTVMFYTQQDDKAIASYDESVLLKIAVVKEEAVTEPKTESVVVDIYDFTAFRSVLNCIEEQFKNGTEVLLAELGPMLKNKGVNYGKSLGKYLKELFSRYHVLEEQYSLILGDAKDRIERIAV